MKELSIRAFCTLLLIIPILLSYCHQEEAIEMIDTATQEKQTIENVADLVKDCTATKDLRFRSTSINIPYQEANKKTIEKAILKMHRLIRTNRSIPHIRSNQIYATYVGLTYIDGQSYEVKVQELEDYFNLQLGYYY